MWLHFLVFKICDKRNSWLSQLLIDIQGICQQYIEDEQEGSDMTFNQEDPFIHRVEVDLRFDIVGRAISFSLFHLRPVGQFRIDETQERKNTHDT